MLCQIPIKSYIPMGESKYPNYHNVSLLNIAQGMDDVSHIMRKHAFHICENKGADQLLGNHAADQRFCFRFIDSTIPLLPKSEISCL